MPGASRASRARARDRVCTCTYTPLAQRSMSLSAPRLQLQMSGVHVHDVQRARRHVDRERRPHAGRQRRAAAAPPRRGTAGTDGKRASRRRREVVKCSGERKKERSPVHPKKRTFTRPKNVHQHPGRRLRHRHRPSRRISRLVLVGWFW